MPRPIVGCELLERYPSGTSNPWQSSRFAGNTAATTASHPVYGDRSRKEEPKLLCGGMPLVRSLTSLQRPHLRWELLIFPHALMPVVYSFKDHISLTMRLILNDET